MFFYIGNVMVNGFLGIGKKEKFVFDKFQIVMLGIGEKLVSGMKQIFDERGVEGFVDWVKEQKFVFLIDIMFRDVYQFLFVIWIRFNDLKKIVNFMAVLWFELFSFEMWGGVIFDVVYCFLKEDFWKCFEDFCKEVLNILFQMLFCLLNVVGYINYLDNVI